MVDTANDVRTQLQLAETTWNGANGNAQVRLVDFWDEFIRYVKPFSILSRSHPEAPAFKNKPRWLYPAFTFFKMNILYVRARRQSHAQRNIGSPSTHIILGFKLDVGTTSEKLIQFTLLRLSPKSALPMWVDGDCWREKRALRYITTHNSAETDEQMASYMSKRLTSTQGLSRQNLINLSSVDRSAHRAGADVPAGSCWEWPRAAAVDRSEQPGKGGGERGY